MSVLGYIDPNTMHHVFNFLGPILAFFAAGAGAIVSVVFFLRRRLFGWLKRTSRLKLLAILTVFVSLITIVILIVYKFILHPWLYQN